MQIKHGLACFVLLGNLGIASWSADSIRDDTTLCGQSWPCEQDVKLWKIYNYGWNKDEINETFPGFDVTSLVNRMQYLLHTYRYLWYFEYCIEQHEAQNAQNEDILTLEEELSCYGSW